MMAPQSTVKMRFYGFIKNWVVTFDNLGFAVKVSSGKVIRALPLSK
jgi:hypothetical protein